MTHDIHNELIQAMREFRNEDREIAERHHKECLDAINKAPDLKTKIGEGLETK